MCYNYPSDRSIEHNWPTSCFAAALTPTARCCADRPCLSLTRDFSGSIRDELPEEVKDEKVLSIEVVIVTMDKCKSKKGWKDKMMKQYAVVKPEELRVSDESQSLVMSTQRSPSATPCPSLCSRCGSMAESLFCVFRSAKR